MDAKEFYLSRPWTSQYHEAVPKQTEVAPGSISDVFEAAAAKYAQQNAIIFYGRSFSYQELLLQVNHFASWLAAKGIKSGDTVALYLLNSPQFIICYLGALKAGAKITPISPLYTSHEILHQLKDSDAKVVICQDLLYEHLAQSDFQPEILILTALEAFLPWWLRAWEKTPFSKTYRKKQQLHLPSEKIFYLEALLKETPPEASFPTIDPEQQVASLSYTGGTTALPKAAALTHQQIKSCAQQTHDFLWMLTPGEETVVAYLPFYHIYGQVVIMLNSLLQGYNLVLFTTPDMEQILNAMERYQSSVFFGVPSLFEVLKEHERTNFVNWKRLKLIISGSDSLHQSTVEAWRRRTDSQIIEGYGMTEAAGVSHLNPLGKVKAGSFGIPMPGMDAAVIDPEGSEFVEVGTVGEIVIAGNNLMQGYWGRSEETDAAFVDAAGKRWYRTGDLGRMDEEGYFYFFDRKRDIIKHKGYAVFARHVEETLTQHPEVKTAGVIGVPHPKVGQLIKAFVVLEGDARGKLSEEELKDYCKEHLAYYKIPQIIEFRGELPKTDVGKISRRELREQSI